MKAVTVQPGVADSVRFEEVPEPDESAGSILVDTDATGTPAVPFRPISDWWAEATR